LTREIESRRSGSVQRPTMLVRSISIAPALLWVEWREGDKASDYAGWQGIFLATPFGTKLLWKRVAWIS